LKTISKKCKYALEALYHLTREYGKGPVLIATMAEQERIPKKFLEAILLDLRNRGVVASKTGRRGGYLLAKPPETIKLGSIIRMIDGPLAPLPCASDTRYRKCDECIDETRCGTRLVMRDVRNAMASILDETSLADVCSRVRTLEREAEDEQALMYHI